MASIRIGGDPESYMEAPQMTVTDKPGGASLIASILDAIGVHKQVAKGPDNPGTDSDKSATPAAPAAPTGTTQSVQPAESQLPVLNEAESAFKPMTPMPTDWGQRYLDSLKPLKTIDPNTAF